MDLHLVKMDGYSSAGMKTMFQFCLEKILYQIRSMRWPSILSKYPIFTLNNFFCSRKQLLMQISAVVFFVNFDTIVTLVTSYHKIVDKFLHNPVCSALFLVLNAYRYALPVIKPTFKAVFFFP